MHCATVYSYRTRRPYDQYSYVGRIVWVTSYSYSYSYYGMEHVQHAALRR